jgi:hypothetical protein
MIRAVLAALGWCLMGCQFDPHSTVYTRTQPKANDLVGTYLPDRATTDLVAREGRYRPLPASITLGEGGALTITNIPDWWNTSFGDSQGGFDSGRGEWSVVRHQRWWAIAAAFDSTHGFASSRGAGRFATSFMLVGSACAVQDTADDRRS